MNDGNLILSVKRFAQMKSINLDLCFPVRPAQMFAIYLNLRETLFDNNRSLNKFDAIGIVLIGHDVMKSNHSLLIE